MKVHPNVISQVEAIDPDLVRAERQKYTEKNPLYQKFKEAGGFAGDHETTKDQYGKEDELVRGLEAAGRKIESTHAQKLADTIEGILNEAFESVNKRIVAIGKEIDAKMAGQWATQK